MNRLTRSAALALIAGLPLLAAVGSAHALAVPISNASFEQAGPNFTGGSYCYLSPAPFPCGAAMPGWTGGVPVIKSNSGPWGNPGGISGWTSALGTTLVGLQGRSFLEQTLTLVEGTHELSWWDAGRRNYAPATYNVLFDGDVIGNFSTAAGQAWAQRSIIFTAAGTGALRFQGTTAVDGTAFIDSVVMNTTVSAVPEPGTIVLALAGLAGLGLARRRQSAAQR